MEVDLHRGIWHMPTASVIASHDLPLKLSHYVKYYIKVFYIIKYFILHSKALKTQHDFGFKYSWDANVF